MKQLEKFISPLIAQMFPAIYRDEGPMFVSFVKAYYEWLESENQAIYHARRLPEYRDIDTTIEDFIVYFKEKYLKNIQFETSSNKRLFIKNAIPFYRAKGTERSVDLFFKLIYGIPAKLYYPGDDIFRLSDGEWVEPIYLEVSPSAINNDFIGKQIVGTNSGAVAFVEDLVVKRVKNRYIHVLYISNLEGHFYYDEIIRVYNSPVQDDISENPRIIGSLTTLDVTDGGSEFEVGETVNLISANGAFAKAIVEEVEDIQGQIDFQLTDGGFGYNSDSQVLISNTILTIANIANLQFQPFETVSQPLVAIAFDTANNIFETGQQVFRYYANNLVSGSGYVLSMNQIANSGNLVVTASSGNLYAGVSTIFTTANAISANITANTNATATGNVVGVSANLSLYANGRTGTYTVGEEVYQSNNTLAEWANGVVRTVDAVGDSVIVRLSSSRGGFISGQPLIGRASGTVSNLQTYTTKLGVYNVNNTFYATDETYNNIANGSASSANGYISTVSVGEDATFSIGSNATLLNVEVANVNLDFLISGRHSNLQFDTSTLVPFTLGTQIYRYFSNGTVAAHATVVGVTQTPPNTNGYILVYTHPGNTFNFAPSANTLVTNTFYTTANAQSAVAVGQVANNDFYTGLDLDIATFGFPTDPSANISSNTLANIFSFESFTIGTIGSITGINPGTSYNDSPFVRVLEPVVYQYGYKDYGISYSGASASFNIGELIKQSNSTGGVVSNGAIGQILASNGSNLTVRRLLVSNSFSASYIVGVTSGAVALADSVEALTFSNTTGFNAVIDANVAILDGSVTSLRMVSSGFGYQNKEPLEFYASDDLSKIGSATANLIREGVAEGFYKDTGGFLSANKYIHDGYYYQEYSYDVLTGLPLDKYSDMFKKVLHVAGTKMFGTYVSETENDNSLEAVDGSTSYFAANGVGTVAGNNTTANLVGTSTTFLTDFANGDYIAIHNGTSFFQKKIVTVVDDTTIIMTGPLSFTNATANYCKVNIG